MSWLKPIRNRRAAPQHRSWSSRAPVRPMWARFLLRAARKLSAEGAGKMFCLAGVGGRVSGIVASTEAAAAILAIDGCPLDCTRKTLEEAGFTNFSTPG